MSDRKSKEYNAIVGVLKGGGVVVLEDCFKYENDLHGATGFIVRPLYQDEIDEGNDLGHIKDEYSFLWQEAVKEGKTELGLEDYIKELLEQEDYNPDTYFIGDDPSFRYEMDKAIEKLSDEKRGRLWRALGGEKGVGDFIDWTSESCGRCVPLDAAEYTLLLQPHLLEAAKKAEKEGTL